jgi:acyl dehydratase
MRNKVAYEFFYEDLTPGLRIDLGSVVLDQAKVLAFAELTGDKHSLHIDELKAQALGFKSSLVHGSLVSAIAIGRLVSAGQFSESIVAMTDSSWKFMLPVFTNDEVSYELLITSRRLLSKGDRGMIGRHFYVKNNVGEVIQEGSSTAIVLTRNSEDAKRFEEINPSFPSSGWVSQLIDSLSVDKDFEEATLSFNGAIAFAFGEDLMGIRLYKGKIIDQGRAVASGATFTIGATLTSWIDFVVRPRNEFISFAMKDKFTVSGSTYDYLRMTKATMIIMDYVRRLVTI